MNSTSNIGRSSHALPNYEAEFFARELVKSERLVDTLLTEVEDLKVVIKYLNEQNNLPIIDSADLEEVVEKSDTTVPTISEAESDPFANFVSRVDALFETMEALPQ